MDKTKGELIEELRDQVRDPRNRLEVHGLAYRFNGFPIFGDEYDEEDNAIQIGVVDEHPWDWWKDLSSDDRKYFWDMVGAYQIGLQRHGNSSDKEYWTHPRIMAILIDEYGIKCWHHPIHRLPKLAEAPPFECRVCDSYILPNRPLTREERAVFENRHVLTAQDYHLVT